MYREVIPRDLTWTTQAGFTHDPAWHLDAGGGLNLTKLLDAFQEFFREHSEHWIERFQYREAAPQLLLQAFLQRIVNSGGRVEREYGLWRMRTDLLIVWPAGAPPARTWRAVIECKLLRRSRDATVRTGLEQTRAYLDRCGAAEGHLVIFDRHRGPTLERETVPQPGDRQWRAGHRVGNVGPVPGDATPAAERSGLEQRRSRCCALLWLRRRHPSTDHPTGHRRTPSPSRGRPRSSR